MYIFHKAWHVYRMEGLRGVVREATMRLLHGTTYDKLQRAKSAEYMKWFRSQQATAEELSRQRGEKWAQAPLMSIVVPTYNVRREYLQVLVQSVQAQTYEKWEMLLADGASSAPASLSALREAEAADSRIKVLYLENNRGISGNTNAAIAEARGDCIVFSDHDDIIEPDALYWLAKATVEQGADLIYTDEDKVDEKGRIYYEPHLKPDWSPDTICSCNYINHLTAVSRKALQAAGGLNSEFDGSQDHEFVLRVADGTTPDKIVHVPRVLYHWRQFRHSMSKQKLEVCQAAGRRAVREHKERQGTSCHVTQNHGYRVVPEQTDMGAGISVIMLSEGGRQDAASCLGRWQEADEGFLKEIILVGGSCQADTEAGIRTVSGGDSVYAGLNRAASEAAGSYLLFTLTGAVPRKSSRTGQVCAPLKELAMYACQPGIGAVGGGLFLADGRFYYATDYLVEGEPKLHYYGHDSFKIARGGLERIVRNVSALPLGLFMVSKKLFLEMGGFDEAYRESLGEVDFCLRLLKAGRRVIYIPFAEVLLTAVSGRKDPQADDAAMFMARWPDCHERYYKEEVV